MQTVDSYDVVYFADDTGKVDLSGTYYVAVYSYQYSTFSIQVSVQRDVQLDGKEKPSSAIAQKVQKPVPAQLN